MNEVTDDIVACTAAPQHGVKFGIAFWHARELTIVLFFLFLIGDAWICDSVYQGVLACQRCFSACCESL